ncbi:MAG: hypothetical protein LZ174_08860 [Thaumarchaeota archaeon]|nr:hypothetical protein [Candidatus Geocrenenecus arthurdayi]
MGKVRKVIKLGKAFAVTLPKGFAEDAEYILLLETEAGLLLKKAEVRERSGRLQDPAAPPLEPPPGRRRLHER